MPDLDTKLHLEGLHRHRRQRGGLLSRLVRAIKAAKREFTGEIYGMGWGDPDVVAPLKFIRDRYVLPYVRDDRTALEIGPGGGRWTRYLLGFEHLIVVDYHAEILEELGRTYREPNMRFIRNNGTDFPGVGDASVDFLFSYGTFIFLDLPLIENYLAGMRRILKPTGNAVIHYSDKKKVMARNRVYADNDRERMRSRVLAAGYEILEEDLTTLWHSNVIRFAPSRADNPGADSRSA